MRSSSKSKRDIGISPEEAAEQAGALWDEGYDCSEAMVRIFSELNIIHESVDRDTLRLLSSGQGLPEGVDFNNRFIYYVGPVDPVRDEVVGPAGPTTSSRTGSTGPT